MVPPCHPANAGHCCDVEHLRHTVVSTTPVQIEADLERNCVHPEHDREVAKADPLMRQVIVEPYVPNPDRSSRLAAVVQSADEGVVVALEVDAVVIVIVNFAQVCFAMTKSTLPQQH